MLLDSLFSKPSDLTDALRIYHVSQASLQYTFLVFGHGSIQNTGRAYSKQQMGADIRWPGANGILHGDEIASP